MKYWTKEVKIALTAICAVVCVFVGINFLKGINVFESSNTYYVKFNDCAGLQVNNAVFANGYPVGTVRSINYNYCDNGGVVAAIELDQQMRLPAGSVAELESGLMGGVTMSLILGPNPADILSPHDTITGGPHEGLMTAAGRMVPQVEELLPKLDSILTSLNALVGSPALSASLNNLEALTGNLAATSAKLPGTMDQLNGMATHFNSVSGKLDQIDLDGTMASVNNTLNETQKLVTHFDEISQTLDRKMNSKDNTLGLLMNDTRLHDDLTHTIQSADSLVTDLKAHPKRYVHFSVFGGKSK